MLLSASPPKFMLPFAANAGGAYKRIIPTASQIGIQNGAASLNDGFPPWCFQAGGYPWGEDFNGLLWQISAWTQWENMGGAVYWDSNLSTALGGYAKGSIVSALSAIGNFWICTVDNNTSNPDTGGAGWAGFSLLGVTSIVFYGPDTGSVNVLVVNPSPAIPSLQAGIILEVTPAYTNTLNNVTLNASGFGAKQVYRYDRSALNVGDIPALGKSLFAYDPTANSGAGGWMLLNPSSGTAAFVHNGVDTGTTNVIVSTVSPPVTTYAIGHLYIITSIANTNSGPVTANLNGIGPRPVTFDDGSPLLPNILKAGQSAVLIDNGTQLHLANVPGAAGPVLQIFNSSGTYVPTPGKRIGWLIATGGGGGGGQGGGGSGSTAMSVVSLLGIAGLSVTIGVGGTGGAVGHNGGNGGTTTVGTFLSAGGGQGGFAANFAIGGWAGVATVGQLLLNGTQGQLMSGGGTGGPEGGGGGGPSWWGGAGNGGSSNIPGDNGHPGTLGGGGGGLYWAGTVGAAGGNGIFVALEF